MDYPIDFQRLCKFPQQKGLEAGGFKKIDVRTEMSLSELNPIIPSIRFKTFIDFLEYFLSNIIQINNNDADKKRKKRTRKVINDDDEQENETEIEK